MNRNAVYSTGEVLEVTLMSRSTLIKRIKLKQFPGPAFTTKHNTHYYCKKEVNRWVRNNSKWVTDRSPVLNPDVEVTVTYTHKEYAELKKGVEALYTTPERFVKDASDIKLKRLLEYLEIKTPDRV